MSVRYVIHKEDGQLALYLFRSEEQFLAYAELKARALGHEGPGSYGAERLGFVVDGQQPPASWREDRWWKDQKGHLPGKAQDYPWTSINTDAVLGWVEDISSQCHLPWEEMQFRPFGAAQFIMSKNEHIVAEVRWLGISGAKFFAAAPELVQEMAMEIRRLQALLQEKTDEDSK